MRQRQQQHLSQIDPFPSYGFEWMVHITTLPTHLLAPFSGRCQQALKVLIDKTLFEEKSAIRCLSIFARKPQQWLDGPLVSVVVNLSPTVRTYTVDRTRRSKTLADGFPSLVMLIFDQIRLVKNEKRKQWQSRSWS